MNLKCWEYMAECTRFLIHSRVQGENVAFVSDWLTIKGIHKLCSVFDV